MRGSQMGSATGSGKAVIVLDEDREIGELSVRFLSTAGFKAQPARSVEDAIRLLREASPQIVTVLISSTFNDSVIVGIDELLRERPRPVLIPTCTQPGRTCVIYRDLPCEEYLGCLRKPFDFTPATLRDRIQSAIERQSAGVRIG